MLRVMVQIIYLKDLDQETIEGPSLLVFVTIPCKHFKLMCVDYKS
jgi:hypothetical protein